MPPKAPAKTETATKTPAIFKLRRVPKDRIGSRKADWILINSNDAKQIIGYEPVLNKEHRKTVQEEGFRVYSHKSLGPFILRNNGHNRALMMGNVETLAKKFLGGTFSGLWNSESDTDNGESWITNGDASVMSCAHRCVALILAQEKRDTIGLTDPDYLSENDIPEVIEIEALFVSGVDDPAANTIDTGKGRANKDVFFRNPEILSEYTATDKARLSGELQKANRLVYARLRGETDQSLRGKFSNEEAISHLTDHPLIEKALVWLSEQDGKGTTENGGRKLTRHHSGCSLGVLTGCFYLAYLSVCDRQTYEDGELDLSQLKEEAWEDTKRFFTDIRLLYEIDDTQIKKADSPIVSQFVGALVSNQDAQSSDAKWNRDTLQSIIAKAFLAFNDRSSGKWKTAAALKKSKDESTRFNTFMTDGLGLDLPKEILKENNWLEVTPNTERSVVGEWKIGDLTWVYLGSEFVDFKVYGSITKFSLDGAKATVNVRDEAGEDEETVYPVVQLCADEPELPTSCKNPKLEIGQEVIVTELKMVGSEDSATEDMDPTDKKNHDPTNRWNGVITAFSDDGNTASIQEAATWDLEKGCAKINEKKGEPFPYYDDYVVEQLMVGVLPVAKN